MHNNSDHMQIAPPKVLEGIVLKVNSKQKMLKILVKTRVRHPIYGKYVKKSKTYNIHWEGDQKIQEGDVVEFISSRPISKIKNHIFLRKVK